MSKLLKPVHPGEILEEEYLKPLGMSRNQLATELHVPAPRINDICRERRGITTDTALRLALYFKTTPIFWMNLQVGYDLEVARRKRGKTIERRVRPRAGRASAAA